MNDLPRQIDRRVRREIATLTRSWQIVKKRDHYFLQIEDQPMICVANNASKCKDWHVLKTLEAIRKTAAWTS